MKISLLVPTRQRQKQFLRFYNSAMELANHPGKVEIVFYTDEDDGAYDELNLYNATRVTGERIVLSEMWNACQKKATGEIYGHMGDDIIFRTEGWDDIVRSTFEEYKDRIVFLFGDDGSSESNKNEFGTHGFIHKNWVDTVGYFVPPYFVSDYNDTFLNDIGRKIGRHRSIPILTEHMHYSLGKSEIDQNTRDRLARHASQHPEDAYNSPWFKAEMEEKRDALMKFMDSYNDYGEPK